MKPDDRDYEAIVSRALHAEAESVEPAGDGLDRIRHRLASPRRSRLRAHASVAWSRLAAAGRLAGRRPAVAGLRPVLAIAGAVAIVVAGALALGRVGPSITPANSVTTSGTSLHPASAHASAPVESGRWAVPIGVEPYPAASRSGNSPAGVPPTIAPSATRTASTPSPTAGPPSPTMTTTTTPTDTATPTPTATPTTTPSGTGTPAPTTTPTSTSTPAATPLQSTTAGLTRTMAWWPPPRRARMATWRVARSGGPGGPGQASRWPRCRRWLS